MAESVLVGHSKHRSAPPPRDQRRLLGIIGALALVGGTAGVWALTSSADAGQEDGHRHTVAAETEASGEATPQTSARVAAADVPSSTLAQCRAEIEAGTAAATAAYQSYRDWSGHVQAQLDFDAGKITRDQTKAIWADTKSRGNADIAAFNQAHDAYRKVAGTCGEPADAECKASATAVSAAVSTGAKVNSGWAAHMQMMADKEHIGASYNDMWRDMVSSAPSDFAPFKAAYEALAKAPGCG